MAKLNFSNVYRDPNKRKKIAAMGNKLYSESDWRTSVANGQSDAYLSTLIKSQNIDPNEFYTKYNLYYGDQNTRLAALYNEVWGDRDTVKDWEITKYDESGNPVPETVKMTEYDYQKQMIGNINTAYASNVQRQLYEQARQNRNGFVRFLSDVGATTMYAGNAVLAGAESISGAILAGLEEFFTTGGLLVSDIITLGNESKKYNSWSEYIKGDSSLPETFNKYYTDYSLNDDFGKLIDQFAYEYSHFYDENGNMTTAAKYIVGTVDTVGRMLPSLAIAYATAGAGSNLSAATLGTSKLASFLTTNAGTIGQLAYYGSNVFGQSVSDQYEYYASQGISIPSSEIVANSLVKTALQLGVEKTLGKILGGSGIDNMFWGTDTSSNALRFSSKNLTAKGFGRLGKDALQEGLEEAMQETSDWFVDAAHHFINHDFQNTEWNWQNIWDAFAIACIVSVGGNAAKIVGTRRVTNGTVKTDEAGNIITDSEGNVTYEKLGKIASWEYGLDLASYAQNIDSLNQAYQNLVALGRNADHNSKVDSKNIQKAMSEYSAAYYEALGSFEILSGLYGEMGETRFAKANEILTKMQKYQDDGVLDANTVIEAQRALVNKIFDDKIGSFVSGIEHVRRDYRAEIARKLSNAGITEVDKEVSSDDDVDDEISKTAKKIIDRDNTIKKVMVSKDGARPVRIGNILIVPENLLRNDPSSNVIFSADAEFAIAEMLRDEVLSIKGVSKAPIEIISDIYKQWSNNEDATDEEVIMNLMFDESFFNCVLTMNEKETVTFVLRLRDKLNTFKFKDTTKDRLFVKRIGEMRKRWTQGAINFYANNLDANYDEYSRFLKGEEREDFVTSVERIRYLFKTGNKIIENPSQLTEQELAFLEKRITNANTDADTKRELRDKFKSDSTVDRASALFDLNIIYEGAFQTLYNGKYYMPNTSVANMVFNNFLKLHNLNIQTFSDPDALTDMEKSDLADGDILEYRQEQFAMLCNNRYNFLITEDGSILIKGDDKVQGWDAVSNTLRNSTTRGNIIAGKKVDFEISKRTEGTRRFATSIEASNKIFRKMLDPSVKEQGIATWVSIDDAVNNPLYLNEEVRENIVSEYGDLSPDSVYVYLQSEFSNLTEGKMSLVTLRDGSVAIQNMTEIQKLFQKEIKFPTSGTYSLDKFISEKVRSQYTKNATVVFGSKFDRYVDWERQSVNGKLTWVFVNRIELRTRSEAEMRFAFAHELQHLLQFEKSMNAGISSEPLKLFDESIQKEIIKEVKSIAKELFVRKPDVVQEKKIVNDYLYFGTGELQAMGLSSTRELASYPVRSKRYANGTVSITLPNGKTYSTAGRVSSEQARNKICGSIDNIIATKFEKYLYKTNYSTKNKRFGVGNTLYHKTLNDKSLRTKENNTEILYQVLGYDMTREEFDKSELPMVNIKGRWYFSNTKRGYESIINYNNNFSANTSMRFGTIKVSDVKNIKFATVNADIVTAEFEVDNRKIRNKVDKKIDFTELPTNVDQSLDIVSDITGEYFGETVNNLPREYLSLNGQFYNIARNSAGPFLQDVLDNVKNQNLRSPLSEYLYHIYGDYISPNIKNRIMSSLTTEDTLDSIATLKKSLNIQGMSEREFLEYKIPIIRSFQHRYDSDSFVSASIFAGEESLNNMALSVIPNRSSDIINGDVVETSDFYIVINNVKIKDIMYFVNDINSTLFVKEDVFYGGDTFKMRQILDSSFVLDTVGKFYSDVDSIPSIFTGNEGPVNLKSLKKLVMRYAEDDRTRLLAEKVFEAANRVYENNRNDLGYLPYFVVRSHKHSGYGSYAGYHRGINKSVSFVEEFVDTDTILHELIHFCLDNSLKTTTELKRLIQKLYYKVLDEHPNGKLDYYGLTNIHEFVAELSDAEFVKFLKSIDLTDNLNAIFKEAFDVDAKTVFDALDASVSYGLENAQYLDSSEVDTSSMKEFNYYQGPVYDGNKLVEKNTTIYTVGALDEKLVNAISNKLDIKKSDSESSADYIRRVLKDTKGRKLIDMLLIKLDKQQSVESDGEVRLNTLYVDGEFPLYDGEISNYTVSPKTVDTQEIVEKFSEREESEKSSEVVQEVSNIPDESETPKKKRRKKTQIVDKREILRVEPRKGSYVKRKTPNPRGMKTELRRVYDVDYNADEPDRVPGQTNADYFYRKFLYRIYYIKNDMSEGYRDIYEMWYRKKDVDRRYVTKEERANRFMKYFDKGDEQMQMNHGLREFLIWASKNEDAIPDDILDKISGENSGTLEPVDIFKYVFKSDMSEISDKLFNVVNRSFFKNDKITSIRLLKKYKELLPKYQALYLLLRKSDQSDWLYDEMSLDEFEKTWVEWYASSESNAKLLEKYLNNFSLKHNQETAKDSGSYDSLEFDDNYIQYKLMMNFDGTILDGAFVGKDARIDAWRYEDKGIGNIFRGDQTKTFLSDTIGRGKDGDELSLEDRIGNEDEGEYESENGLYRSMSYDYYYDKTREKLVKTLSNFSSDLSRNIVYKIDEEGRKIGLDTVALNRAFDLYLENIKDGELVSNDDLANLIMVADKNFNGDDYEVNKAIETIMKATEMDRISPETIESIKRRQVKETVERKTSRRQHNLKNSIQGYAARFRPYLYKDSTTRFLKDNSDLFERDPSDDKYVSLKENVLYEYINGESVLRSEEELEDIRAKLKSLSSAVYGKAYQSDAALSYYKKLKKAEAKNKAKIVSKSNESVIHLQLGNGNTLDVAEEAHIPESLKKLIEFGKAKDAVTRVQEFSKSENVEDGDGKITKKYTESHAKLIYNAFIDNASEILAEIGRDGANEIVDFYLTNRRWIIAGADDRIAMNLQQLLIGFLYSKHYHNSLNFDQTRLDLMTEYLKEQASIGGAWLSNQKSILNMLKENDPDQRVDQALLDYIGIKMDGEDRKNLHELLNAVRNTQDNKELAQKKYMAARKKFEDTLMQKYKGNKKTFLSKMLTFERAMMLSSPTTWIRNFTSNVIVTGGNITAAQIGDKTVELLGKLFNKKGLKHRDDQYRIVGTKVSDNTMKFVKTAFIDSKFFDTIATGLNKYDPRRIGKYSSGDNIVDMMAMKIGETIKRDVVFTGDSRRAKYTNYVIKKIFSAVSDDPFIKRKVIRYLGKIIEEEKVKNPKLKLELTSNSMYGISNDMLDLFVKAYELAAFDYMHSTNWVMDMERQLSIRLGEKGYFVYKQIFPFLGAAWNWSVEGMRYTPAGLVKALWNLGKLENTIYKMDKARQEGKPTVNSEFAEYIARRNVGKGIIGTTAFFIGVTLALIGKAGIDEEDDKYKLIIDDVKIDISDVLSSQGALLGIAVTSEIMSQNKDPLRVFSTALNQLFEDSVFQTVIDSFRYQDGVGGFMKELIIDDVPSMFIPNFLKALASVSHNQGINYGSGIEGAFNEFAAKNLPGYHYIFGQNFKVDIYTGNAQSFWDINTAKSLMNKLSPIDVEFTNAGSNELEAISLGIRKGNLNGKYKIADENIELSASELTKLNVLYGKLNNQSINNLRSNGKKIKQDDGTYKFTKYSAMDGKQKKAAIESVLSTNGQYSKIYILTSTGKYKYYASDSEYAELKKLGITKNVYKKTNKLEGFVKI